MSTIDIKQFGSTIVLSVRDIMVQERAHVFQILRHMADLACMRCKEGSPGADKSQHRTGRYKRGWRVDDRTNEIPASYVVTNTKYQIVHLLENGTEERKKIRTGQPTGRVDPDAPERHNVQRAYNEAVQVYEMEL